MKNEIGYGFKAYPTKSNEVFSIFVWKKGEFLGWIVWGNKRDFCREELPMIQFLGASLVWFVQFNFCSTM